MVASEDVQKPAARPMELGAPGRIQTGFPKWLAVAFMFCAILLAVFLNYNVFPFGFYIDDTVYAYWTLALCSVCVFMNRPIAKRFSTQKIQLWDWVMAGICFVILAYFGANAYEIGKSGWGAQAPLHALILSGIIFVLMLSLAHRIFGTLFFLVCAFFAFVPMFAESLPGILSGLTYPPDKTITQMVLGPEGINGVTMRVAARIIVSFMPFMLSMLTFGGAKFLTGLALSIVGRFRGAGAKVAVVASAMMASMSGGASVNVITTGTVTIPMMKRSGYPPYYAGAIEACASTGGTLTPPIMGSSAYIIAAFLLMDYWKVALAAAIPAVLYYVSLFAQVDIYAKVNKLKGESPEALPKFGDTLRNGWYFIPALMVFVYMLLGPRIEAKSGYFGIMTLFACYYVIDPLAKAIMSRFSSDSKDNWWRRVRNIHRDVTNILLSIAKTTASIMVLLAVIGFVIAGVNITGIALSMTDGLLHLSGGNIFLLLLIGAVSSFILGMGMVSVAVYVIVAILLAPALEQVGLNPLAVHLFCLYWGMLGNITPPVAISAMIASQLAGAEFFKTAVQSMRAGIGLFILPFFFVLSPVLVLQGLGIMGSGGGLGYDKFALDFITCCVGLVVLAMAFEGGIFGVKGRVNLPSRIFLFLGGFLLALPRAVPGMDYWVEGMGRTSQWVFAWSDIIGVVVAVVVIVLYIFWSRIRPPKETVALPT
ncbi:MAG: TRAP transporter fused permease subunit [Chloroflexota bacterium]